jgi:hypothetical protein
LKNCAFSGDRILVLKIQIPKRQEAISKIGFWIKVSRRNSAGKNAGPSFNPPRLLAGSSSGILKYVEDLKREPNADIGPKSIFRIASSLLWGRIVTVSILRKNKIWIHPVSAIRGN